MNRIQAYCDYRDFRALLHGSGEKPETIFFIPGFRTAFSLIRISSFKHLAFYRVGKPFLKKGCRVKNSKQVDFVDFWWFVVTLRINPHEYNYNNNNNNNTFIHLVLN